MKLKLFIFTLIFVLISSFAFGWSDNDYTNEEKTIVGNTSNTNSGDETDASIATINHAASEKSTLVNADEIVGSDSADTFSIIRTTWTDVKAFLKTANDLLYHPLTTVGIADDNLIEVDDAGAAADDVAIFTANGLKGLKYNFGTSVAPGVNDDIDLGYTVGSKWYDTTADDEYTCLDNTDGAAVWSEGGGGAESTVTVPDGDGTYSGAATVTLTANENQVFGEVVTIEAAGEATLAKADVAANAGAMFIALATISADSEGLYAMPGTFVCETDWDWTPGTFVYLSAATAGAMTQTEPSGSSNVVQILGIAMTADTILFNPTLLAPVHD